MSPDTWSFITASASIAGLVMARWNPKYGWRWGFICQGVWIDEGISLHRRGDVFLSVVFIGLYLFTLATNQRSVWTRPRRGQTRAQALREAADAAEREEAGVAAAAGGPVETVTAW